MSTRLACWVALLTGAALLPACAGSAVPSESGKGGKAQQPPRASASITVIGTNDLHGHIEMLPMLGGYLKILRAKNPGSVLLVDGGDMFQGTLASNLKEGAPIIEAYNLLGYDAATIGNHEFDFGPVGADATVTRSDQDPRGALKARAAAAKFPLLGANLIDTKSQSPVAWPNVAPSTMVRVADVQVGIIGITTFETPHVTLAANFVGLNMAPLVETITARAKALRDKGAKVIVVAAHSGGACTDFSDHKDLSSCGTEHEIYQVANRLAPSTVDVIVAGHTHRGMAHEINGIAIIESFAKGQAFGRVDLEVSPTGEVTLVKLHPPRFLCAEPKETGPGCESDSYEGSEIVPDPAIAVLAKGAADFAEQVRSKEIGIVFAEPVKRSRSEASTLGNLFVELMLDAQPSADIAITNGGSLRADLPKGPLRYGDLFEAMPFDNRFAMVSLRGKTLRKLFESNLQNDSGILSVAGMRVAARCRNKALDIQMTRDNGKVIRDQDLLLLATSDFIASGGDGLLGAEGMKLEKVEIDGGLLIRDAMAKVLGDKPAHYSRSVGKLHNAKKPRIQFSGTRPLSCAP
jgi:2',3'-cyclic-nucleotide 2'-phosphodiesterase (5'-nucleotidase family)